MKQQTNKVNFFCDDRHSIHRFLKYGRRVMLNLRVDDCGVGMRGNFMVATRSQTPCSVAAIRRSGRKAVAGLRHENDPVVELPHTCSRKSTGSQSRCKLTAENRPGRKVAADLRQEIDGVAKFLQTCGSLATRSPALQKIPAVYRCCKRRPENPRLPCARRHCPAARHPLSCAPSTHTEIHHPLYIFYVN